MKRTSSGSKQAKPQGSEDVDAYLKSLPTDAQTTLQKVRKAIRSAAPGAKEGFSYGLPAFRLKGRPFVCYGAAKNHCSFFPMSPEVIRAHARDLKAYPTSKGPSGSPLKSPYLPPLSESLSRRGSRSFSRPCVESHAA